MSARIRNTKLEKKIIMDCAEVFAEYHFRKHNRVPMFERSENLC